MFFYKIFVSHYEKWNKNWSTKWLPPSYTLEINNLTTAKYSECGVIGLAKDIKSGTKKIPE